VGAFKDEPHPLQNLLPTGFTPPHAAHVTSRGSVAPQALQNAAVSGFSCSQAAQRTSHSDSTCSEDTPIVRNRGGAVNAACDTWQ